MAFADFSLESAVARFELTLPPRADLFAHVEGMEIPPVLREVLKRWAPHALEVNTERSARSSIIAPILMEAMHLAGDELRSLLGRLARRGPRAWPVRSM